jgi:CRP/FNR family cyclic AMP-dependent transcriptional regulator
MDLQLLQTLPAVSCTAGEVLITEGRPAGGLYFLETGEVEVLKGGELVAEVYGPGPSSATWPACSGRRRPRRSGR